MCKFALLLMTLSFPLFAQGKIECDPGAQQIAKPLRGYIVCDKHDASKCKKIQDFFGTDFSVDKELVRYFSAKSASVIKQNPEDKEFTIVLQLDEPSACWLYKESIEKKGQQVAMAVNNKVFFNSILDERVQKNGKLLLLIPGVKSKNKVLEVCRQIYPRCI